MIFVYNSIEKLQILLKIKRNNDSASGGCNSWVSGFFYGVFMFTKVHMCVECKKYKATEKDFHRKRNSKRGWSGECKICKSERVKRDRDNYSWNNKSYRIEYYKKNPEAKLRDAVRLRMSKIFIGSRKMNSDMELYLGCTLEQWKEHIEGKFKDGMNWGNHGEWHLDHIVPCSWFDMDSVMDRLLCFNYRNTQPLWAEENLSKGNYRL